MSLLRRRSDRPDPARRRLNSGLTGVEALEDRRLLSGLGYYQPLPNANANTLEYTTGNAGKVVSGEDRSGNLWTIKVSGPGEVIVTDTTPNDGALDDDLATIQLVGTDPNKTTVVGQTTASNRVLTNGEVLFNELIASSGVKSIELNGFVLTQTIAPSAGGVPNSQTGVFLLGGARYLEFTGVQASVDQSLDATGINIVDGDPNNPLPYKASVKIDELTNTVFNSTTLIPSTTPLTVPTIDLQINAEASRLNFVSAGEATVPAAEQYLEPIVGATGRTAIQAKGIDVLNFAGSATNVSIARASQPFSSATSGLSHLGHARFGSTTDALAIDVAGKIGGLNLVKGLGNPTGDTTAATSYGIPAAKLGYPANGLLGGLVTAGSIGKLKAGAADVIATTSNNPLEVQQGVNGEPTYYVAPGSALTNAGIVSKGNINSVKIKGNLITSEIKSGFDLTSYNQGLEGVRTPSSIRKIKIKGDLVSSVVSASYRPSATGYGTAGSIAGPGSLSGTYSGSFYNTGATTALGNKGVGFYAAVKTKNLPPG